MTEYVLEVINDLLRPPPPYDCGGGAQKLYIKIDKNGNVDIKSQHISICSGHPNQYCAISDVLIINDDIPIPNYIITMLKELLPSTACQYTKLYQDHYNNVISCIKILKKELKALAFNPQNEKDIKIQLKYSTTQNGILKEEIIGMEQKIKNIQTSYFDTLKDNEKIKEENKQLLAKIEELKNNTTIKPPNTKKGNNTSISYSNNKIEQPPRIHSLQNCWSNPGGATIYTQSNAQNKMVYNEDSGIYEPEENV
jgi:hypothetical protein